MPWERERGKKKKRSKSIQWGGGERRKLQPKRERRGLDGLAGTQRERDANLRLRDYGGGGGEKLSKEEEDSPRGEEGTDQNK